MGGSQGAGPCEDTRVGNSTVGQCPEVRGEVDQDTLEVRAHMGSLTWQASSPLPQGNGTSGPVFRSFATPCVPSRPCWRSVQLLAGPRITLRDNRFGLAAVSVS